MKRKPGLCQNHSTDPCDMNKAKPSESLFVPSPKFKLWAVPVLLGRKSKGRLGGGSVSFCTEGFVLLIIFPQGCRAEKGTTATVALKTESPPLTDSYTIQLGLVHKSSWETGRERHVAIQ